MKLRSWILFALSFTVEILANQLAGYPENIEIGMSRGLWAAIFFHFALWLLAIRGSGAEISRRLGSTNQGEGIYLALGSFFYAFFAFFLGAAGLLRPELRWVLFTLNALGVALNPKLKPPRFSFVPAMALIPLLVIFALNFLDTLVIHPYWDALHHHLLGPRLWWEQGRIYFPREAISAYQEGGFEHLFLWPHFFFAGAGGLGLLPVQIFAQLTHSVLAFGGSILLAWQLAKKFIPVTSARILALLLFAMPASLQFAIPTAKNEWGLVLWVLSGILLVSEGTLAALAAGGALLGFSLLAKFSSVFVILPFLLVAPSIFPAIRSTKFLGALAGGFFVGTFPLALRNYLGAGDPFFPLFANWFPGTVIGPTWKMALDAYRSGTVSVGARLLEGAREFLFAPVLLALPILWPKREDTLLRALALALPLGFLLFLATAGAPAELRLMGTCLPIAGLLAGILIYRLLEFLPYPDSLPLVLIAVTIPFLPFRWDALGRRERIAFPELQARGYIGAEAQGWFRHQYVPGQKAALLVDTRLYHSVPYPIVRIWDAPALDEKLRGSKTPEEFLRGLKAAGFSHLILTQEKLDLFYPRQLVSDVEAYVLAHSERVVFRTPYSMVLDLKDF